MKKLFMLLPAFVALPMSPAHANDTCEIMFNKQVIFKGDVEQENSVAFLKAKPFQKSDCLTIRYYSENAKKEWKRTFYINDSALKDMNEKKQPVFIYTTSLPTDKAMAGRIRVRRVFICKIEWN